METKLRKEKVSPSLVNQNAYQMQSHHGLRQRHTATGGQASPSTTFRQPEAPVAYEADWHSGSELSDAYETDGEDIAGIVVARGEGGTSTRSV